METAIKIPWTQRINFRLLFFVAFMALLLGYPVYILLDMQLSGGVKQAAGGYLDVNLKAMSTFTFDQANGTEKDIPQQWRDLDGKKVILRGEMWSPTGAGDDVDSFVLVYSIAECCVTSTPQVQHFVHARPMEGKRVQYYEGPVEARGVLHVNVKQDAGRVSSVYQFDVESIRPAA